MPNWVQNDIVIRGNKKDLLHLQQRVSAPVVFYRKHKTYEDTGMYLMNVQESVFYFMNVISPLEDGFEPEGFNWSNWRINTWGTKWDAIDPSFNTKDCGTTEGQIYYFFNTAWSEPEEVLRELSRLYPNLEIENHWDEEQGFGECVIYSQGIRTIIDSWDIHESEQEEEEQNEDRD
jgi:hypothetical protein